MAFTPEEKEVPLDDVPESIINVALDTLPEFVITEAEIETTADGIIYELEGLLNGVKYEIEISSEGTILEIEKDDDDDHDDKSPEK